MDSYTDATTAHAKLHHLIATLPLTTDAPTAARAANALTTTNSATQRMDARMLCPSNANLTEFA